MSEEDLIRAEDKAYRANVDADYWRAMHENLKAARAVECRHAAWIIRGLLRNCSDWGDDDSISSAINDEERAILTAARAYIAEADAQRWKGEKL